jgi:2-hydroxy-6-oxonona-2,4-dienedioate hydrolase
MTIIRSEVTVAGRKVSILRAGPIGGEPILLVHGGRAGITPIAAGAYLWDRAIPYLSAGRPVIALDLPGCGHSDLGNADMLSVDLLSAHLLGVLDALSLASVHLVGHDFGGLIGLWTALTAPAKLRSLSLVASGVCVPTGDGLNDILFDALPVPLWSQRSQAWAFERVSYSHGHIDDALLSACVAAAEGKPHGDVVKAMQDAAVRARNYGINAIKGKIWAALRTGGLQVPTQLVWSNHDPQASREAGYVLFKVIAEKQRATHFHLVNRAGSFPFREQPEEFGKIVAAFHDGIDVERAA